MYRQLFHITPPHGLLNDPNGFIYWRGDYHLFYQWLPHETRHGAKHWAHLVSRDLRTWSELPVALSPVEWYESHGCYSGSAIAVDDELLLMYTGNVKDEHGVRSSYQCLARSIDGLKFEKLGPVIEVLDGYTAHFRDPKVWVEDGRYFVVIGAQRVDGTGAAVLLESDDLRAWQFVREVAPVPSFGYMWECPDFFRLDGVDVLLVCPQGIAAAGYQFHNVYQSGYWLNGTFTELDRGFDFYAPQTTIGANGERLLIGWMGVPEQEEFSQPTVADGWVHCLTMPRRLTMRNGRLWQQPAVSYEHGCIAGERFNGREREWAAVGEATEWLFSWDGSTPSFTLMWFNEVKVSYCPVEQLVTVARRHFVTREWEARSCVVAVEQLHAFVDRSSIELFVNGGEEVFSLRCFPQQYNCVTYRAEGGIVLMEQREIVVGQNTGSCR